MFINSRKGFIMSRTRAVSYSDVNITKQKNPGNKNITFGQEAAIPVRVATKSSLAVLATSAIFMRNKIAASALYKNVEIIVLKITKALQKTGNEVLANLKKTTPDVPKFLEEEKVIIAKYKKYPGSEEKIFDILQGHGLNDESLNYIKDTSSMMKSKSKSAMSLRDHLKIALSKETPLEVIEDLLTRSAMYRKIWKLDYVKEKNNTELAKLLLNRKVSA